MVFGRAARSRQTSKETHPVVPPPPQIPVFNVWDPSIARSVQYRVCEPWQWVMDAIAERSMQKVPSIASLFSQQLQTQDASATPTTRRRRTNKQKGPSTVCVEFVEDGELQWAVHGTSSAMDGLDDKDELVRTFQRCRCDHLNLSPPSILISWDVTRDECRNVVGESLPVIDANKDEPKFAVLKEPMGSQGKGIYFVSNADEIHATIEEHHQRAMNEPEFLDNLIAAKGRIPSWVLQAEVSPSLLLKDKRKFHIRTYLCVLEKPQEEEPLELFVYNRHELRIAGVPVSGAKTQRDPIAYITNGALSKTTERVLLDNVDELKDRNLQSKLESFVAQCFAKWLLPDMEKRVQYCATRNEDHNSVRKFVVAGLDLMVTEQNRVYLLEVNVNPAAPHESTVDEKFKKHLKGFLHDLIDLVVGSPSPNFMSLKEILDEQQ